MRGVLKSLVIGGAVVMALTAAPAVVQRAAADEIQRDRQELRRDEQELRNDQRDLRELQRREDIQRQAGQRGAAARTDQQIRQKQSEIRRDRAEIERDKAELQRDQAMRDHRR